MPGVAGGRASSLVPLPPATPGTTRRLLQSMTLGAAPETATRMPQPSRLKTLLIRGGTSAEAMILAPTHTVGVFEAMDRASAASILSSARADIRRLNMVLCFSPGSLQCKNKGWEEAPLRARLCRGAGGVEERMTARSQRKGSRKAPTTHARKHSDFCAFNIINRKLVCCPAFLLCGMSLQHFWPITPNSVDPF